MKPEGGIAAVGLAQGNELWRSSEAAKPLTVSGDLLVSQAEPKAGERALRIVTLNTAPTMAAPRFSKASSCPKA